MIPPWRARALIWVRLAVLPALAGAAFAGSTPDPVSGLRVGAGERPAPISPPPPSPVVSDDRALHWRPRPPPTTSTTMAARPPPAARTAPRRPPATIASRRPASPSELPQAAERWRSIVAGYADWPVTTMLWVIWCESRGNPLAQNSSGASGLFQHLPPPAGWRDPAVNTAAAHSKWASRGMQPWSSSSSCWRGH